MGGGGRSNSETHIIDTKNYNGNAGVALNNKGVMMVGGGIQGGTNNIGNGLINLNS